MSIPVHIMNYSFMRDWDKYIPTTSIMIQERFLPLFIREQIK